MENGWTDDGRTLATDASLRHASNKPRIWRQILLIVDMIVDCILWIPRPLTDLKARVYTFADLDRLEA